ncbi:MAG: sugar ABC transporter permease [Spirochaetae bacterium HGW-Spirochaetae-4]|nr:MAG: sugar ABC transporter permease [Spirochaetes bacterium GWC2_52_13]OHD68858.1 MAG: sugar ABC transporter permease [Spirochaetes bacterium GWF2_52_7]PKL20067.1 MAG: sugar ABC transporter permease [Spirochaetae bacterium HGW-Spirochaetae-4]HCG62986.1 sugar ABC transporter permease [Sphaerochaeta sp.]HCS35261.1 sugar ABC transporter permease [Sphaerochaeta sp.]
MHNRFRKRYSYWLLTAPGLVVFLLVIMFPVIYSVSLSFTEWSGYGTPKFVGMKNYIDILSDSIFLHGLRNNLLIVFISVFGQIPLGFIFAYILHRRMVGGGRFFQTMIFLPITISSVVVALLWNQIFSASGLFTAFMRIITEDPRYVIGMFEQKNLAIVPILFVLLWMHTGTYMVIYLANLQKISPSIIEAAQIDGASEGQTLRRIILPSMFPVIATTAIFAISGSLKAFDLIYAMTGGGPAHFSEVIAIYMYVNTFKYYKYGFGSAASIIIILLSVGLILILQFFTRRIERRNG